MIKVTVPNGMAYEFSTATEWEVYGPMLRVYEGQQLVAEFSSFLLVQKVTAEEPQI